MKTFVFNKTGNFNRINVKISVGENRKQTQTLYLRLISKRRGVVAERQQKRLKRPFLAKIRHFGL